MAVFERLLFALFVFFSVFFVGSSISVKDVTPFDYSLNSYARDGNCAHSYLILVNSTDANLKTNGTFFILQDYGDVKIYHCGIMFDPILGDRGTLDLQLSDVNSSIYYFPNFFNYICPDKRPDLDDVVYLKPTVYPYRNVKGYYETILNFSKFEYYSSLFSPTSLVGEAIISKNYYSFSYVLQINEFLDPFSFTVSSSPESKTFSLNSFLANDQMPPISLSIENYPPGTPCQSVAYYHSYWLIKVSVPIDQRYYVHGEDNTLYNKVLLPVLGNKDNATMLMLSIVPSSSLSSNAKLVSLNNPTSGTQTHFDTVCTFLSRPLPSNPVLITGTAGSSERVLPFKMSLPHFEGSIYLTRQSIGYSASNFKNVITQYPFGYLSVTSTDITFGAVFNSLNNVLGYRMYYSIPFSFPMFKDLNIGSTVPMVPPVFDKIELIESDNDIDFIIIAHQPSFGSISSIIAFTDNSMSTELKQQHLVKGTMANGVFKTTISKREMIKWQNSITFSIFNVNLNSTYTKSGNVYNRFGYIAPFNPTSALPLLPDGVLDIYFEQNDVDVNYRSVNISLYIKLASSKKNYVLSFTPSFYLHYTQFGEKEYLDDTTYYSVWDNDKECYRIDFNIPQNRFTDVIGYKILPYDQDHVFWAHLFGDKAELRVKSTNADMLPPIVKTITASASNVMVTSGSTKVGYLIKIIDEFIGFKKGIITIKSERDRQGYNFTITPADTVSGDMFDGDYEIYFNVSTTDVTQQYYISFIHLEDNSGNTAIYPSYDDISPFMLFDHSQLPIIDVTQYTPHVVTDTSAPTITSLDYYPKEINETTEFITFYFTVKDDIAGISSRHIPSVYLSNIYFDLIGNTSNYITNDDGSNSYLSIIYIPRLFCSPTALISIYNLVDKNLNLRGYTASDLKDNGLYFNVESTMPSTPLIISVTNTDSVYTITGFRFGIRESDTQIKVIQTNDVDSYLINNFISFGSGIITTDQIDSFNGKDVGIQVIVDGLASNIFTITITDDTPLPTTPNQGFCSSDLQCGGALQGQCINNYCVCIKPYYGNDCKSKLVDNSTQTVDPEEPSISIDYKTLSSLVSIYSLKELDINGILLTEHILKEWNYTQSDNTHYYQTFIQHTTQIKVTLQKYEQETNITFAGTTLVMQPLSVKYTIDISRYPFTNSLNSLQLVMKVGIETTDKESCSATESGNANNNEIDYCRVQINDVSLYGRFIKRGIIDSRINSITNTITINTQNSSASSANSFIGINIPQYKRFVRIDPDFSVLIEQNKAKDLENSICSKSNNKKLTNAQIAGIVIGGVIFVFIIVALTLYIIAKKFDDKTIGIKLRRVMKTN